MARHEALAGLSRVPGHAVRGIVPLIALAMVIGSAITAGASVDEPAEEFLTVEETVPDVVDDGAGAEDGLGEPLPDTTAVEPEAITEDGSVEEPAEEIRTVEGTVLNVVVEDDEGSVQVLGEALPVVTAVEVDDEYYELPEEMTSTLATGDVVEVTVASDADVAIEDALQLAAAGEVAQAEVLAVEETVESISEDITLAEGAVAHSLTVLPVYWSPGPSTDVASLRTLANSGRDYWSSQTGGQLTIPTIDVRDWVQISAPPSCTSQAMMDLFAAARAAHGVAAPSGNTHVLVYFPQWGSCGWSGMATVGGGMIWINGTLIQDVFAHEFGHNLGLGHANALTCWEGGSRVPLTLSGCTVTEYRDYADVMGIGMSSKPTGSLNTALADHLGMVTLTDLTTLPSGGVTAGLAPLADVSGHRALRMPVAGGQVYVDYRPAVGRDTRWAGWAGVQVHLKTVDSRGIPTSYILNMRPETGDFTSPSTVNPSLPAGRSWLVPGAARAVTVVSAGATASVRVESGAGTNPVSNYVTRVYLDLFKRAVDPAGLQTWTNALQAGVPRVAVANAITYSPEYRSRLITTSYLHYLNRAPDAAGLQNWLGMMGAGGTIQQMEGGFISSPEYYAKAGGTDEQWVGKLYLHVLGRLPASSEVDHWVRAVRSGMSRYQVAMGFLLSTEHLASVVDGYYWELLGRGIDPAGRSTWVSAIQHGARVEAIIGALVASDEYFLKG
jgi:hypothetical protein